MPFFVDFLRAISGIMQPGIALPLASVHSCSSSDGGVSDSGEDVVTFPRVVHSSHVEQRPSSAAHFFSQLDLDL
jgi:hypothetical protein